METNRKTQQRELPHRLHSAMTAILLTATLTASVALAGGAALSQSNRRPTQGSAAPAKRRAGDPELRDYMFETVTVTSTGKIANRRRGHAQYYVEPAKGVGLEMVKIPGGSFTMGSLEEESNGPLHRVNVRSFYMGKYEVTQAQWRVVAKLPKVSIDLNTDPSRFKYDKLPVEQVSLEAAVEFCARLSRVTGRTYRLPSEAEWEYACRGGATTEFAFGATITPELANYDGNLPYGSAPQGWNRKQTTPVGSLGVANNFGLYDMHGNVQERCLDPDHYGYKGAPTDGSVWEAGGNTALWAERGGAWDTRGYSCGCGHRSFWNGGPNANVGFRVVAVSEATPRGAGPRPKTIAAPAASKPAVAGGVGPGGIPLLSYDFDTVTIDSNGVVTDRPRLHARYYEEHANGTPLEMVDIPGGSFTMGEPRTGPDYDQMKPAHKVTVPPFYMGKFEVTQAQWRAVANLRKVSRDLQPSPSHFKGANLPVDSVSWNDAMEFCARLSRATGRAYRLPTEAEWEYACRGGTTTPYSFGETLTPWVVNFDGRFSTGSAPAGVFRRKTTPVGSMEVASGFGVFDMDGNVREWCMDYWHENYKGAPADGSAWRTGGAPDSRVTRGGSWDLPGHMCGAAERNFCSPDSCRLEVFGFRVVMDVRTR